MLSILITLWFLHVVVLLTLGTNLLLVSQLAAGATFGAIGLRLLAVSAAEVKS